MSVEKFKNTIENRHDYAENWKQKSGKKALGCICTYVPEELIYAAGLLPVRILCSGKSVDNAIPHIHQMYCPVCRDMLSQGLRGEYDYLDGITYSHACVGTNQCFASWQRHVPVSFSHIFRMPAKPSSIHAVDFVTDEMRIFKKELEKWLGCTIDTEAIEKSIAVYNKNRRLLRRLYETAKVDDPVISGSDRTIITIASMIMDKAEHSEMLEAYLNSVDQSKKEKELEPKPRLMIIGSECDNLEAYSLIESLDTDIVIDEICTGTRYFWDEIPEDNDPLVAIARRYVEREPCPLKDGEKDRRRLKHIKQLAQEYGIDGAILLSRPFCYAAKCDEPATRELFKEMGIPTAILDYDSKISSGQWTTRVQAFIEMLDL